ncbi:unnamed protein product [Eruca vesicaria subsp. sativa]|uniref:F-box associated beta-propeller type 3 domain-containing protein n=1 Tax=Eruca vesicaria subsp. sativa TaxID=29727 RepID=A0ABC8KV81_ERUVS|nr:unnamed protein product [Eruca vesicaria subsp. sativa]
MVETRAQHRRRVTWDGVESNQDVFRDILSRLSVRSICSMKKVNKYWHVSVSGKYFATKQLAQSRKKPSYIACPSVNKAMKLYLLKPGKFSFRHHTTVDPSGRIADQCMHMISSFNGLVCCINQVSDEDEDDYQNNQIWICNPSTEETLLLPQGRPSFLVEPSIGVAYGPDISEYKIFRIFSIWICNPSTEETLLLPQGRPSFLVEPSIGVAYGPDISEYKIFRIFSVGEKNDGEEGLLLECEVYSSSTGAWRSIGTVLHLPISDHVFAGGKIYWLVSLEDPGIILSVDMDERFGVIELPHYPTELREEDRITVATHLINLGGSLSLVVLHAYSFDVWVWKEASWVLVIEYDFPFEGDELVLSITSSENEILFVTESHLWTYHLDTRKWNKRGKPPTRFKNPAMFPFTESLLPCNGGVRLEGR